MATYPVQGIDVSRYQTTTPPLNGLSFLFARAAYADRPDGSFAGHIMRAKAAGLTTGAYLFGVGWASVQSQVDALLAQIKAHPVDLVALDMEKDAAGTMTATQARQALTSIRAAGFPPGLYHSKSGYPQLGQSWRWVADYQKVPDPGIPWDMWQWTSNSGTPLDRDRFHGSVAQWEAWLNTMTTVERWRVVIHTTHAHAVPLYDRPYGKVVGHFTRATFLTSIYRAPTGRNWYHILSADKGAPTRFRGRWLPQEAGAYMTVTEV